MRISANCVVVALVVGCMGCNAQTSNVANVAQETTQPSRLPGTNAGSNAQLTSQVSGWTYALMAGQDRDAGYQFNDSGSVVATVGKEGRLDYPALFWRIDEHDRIVIAEDREFREFVELWTIVSIDGSVVTVQNAINDRKETYSRTATLAAAGAGQHQ